jgi:hypothetical protein
MDEKVLQALEKFAQGLTERFNVAGQSNSNLSAEYLKESSYRLSNLYITLNVGVLSASSFVLSNRELNLVSKSLVPLLLGSIIAIVIEAWNRKRMLKVLDSDAWDRMGNADNSNMEIGKAFQQHLNDPLKCADQFKIVADMFNQKNNEQHQITNKKLDPVMKWRTASEILSILSLLSLFTLALSELGILKSIINPFIKFLELFVHSYIFSF